METNYGSAAPRLWYGQSNITKDGNALKIEGTTPGRQPTIHKGIGGRSPQGVYPGLV